MIELLVVVGIIGVLVAMLLPVLGTVREAGRRAVCASNLRQVGMAITENATENGELLPNLLGGVTVVSGQGNGIHIKVHCRGRWAMNREFGPLGNVNLLLCPSDRKPVSIATTDPNDNPITIRSSYNYNYALWITKKRITDVPQASTLLAVDGHENYDPQQGVWYSGVNNSLSRRGKDVDNFNNSAISRRHNGRFNALFLDNHVEVMTKLPYNSILPGFQ